MSAFGTLAYRVASHQPRAHLFDLSLCIPDAAPTAKGVARDLRLSLPAWIPGSYMIRDFARHLISIHAQDANGPLPISKSDKQSWHLSGALGSVHIHYQVYAGELSVRAAHLDHTHGYFNGACLLLHVDGCADWPCELEIERPADPCAAHWRLATSLPAAGAPAWGFGRYRAANYAALIDHPVEMGAFELVEFSVRDIPHAMAISGHQRADFDRLSQDLPRICEQQAALFGELPLERYLFLTQTLGTGYGGLEHRSSASLLCARDDLPQPQVSEVTAGYRRFLGLCSHEYFHLWNVKRIRPQVFMEQGLEREVHTRLLWAFEGLTSYYDDLTLVRAGLISPRDYLELLANTITRVQRDPGRQRQTVAESSFDAWTKFYQQDANAPNAIVSYYSKGALIALALDLTIRQRSHNRHSLDDLMRALWQRYGRTGQGVPETGPEALAAEITGLDLQAFFDQALDDTKDLDLAPLLASVGVALRMRPARDVQDLGGVCEQFQPIEPQVSIGARWTAQGNELKLTAVLNDRPAERAGLAPGDILIALDAVRIEPSRFATQLARCSIGETVIVHAFRRDELHRFELTPEAAPHDTCELMPLPDAPPAAQQAQANWLHQPSTATATSSSTL
ncbi:M61 family metallopeptidase [Rhabdochromatium marinum]|uniref:M61 family metallopeptidase n=1 Tax=Rhabdochromatium marinum TaxID=48729 RepID=UPI001902CD97|nr:PDZ domain-containing protein [Rhabdochromatium marinum]MBK1649358.1 peptidase M61 [Rhabdochromatium marinum]